MRFKNAPIQEALLDIRVVLPNDITLENLQSFNDEKLKAEFPIKKRRERMQGEISFDDKGQIAIAPASRETDGYLFSSDEKQKFVQVRKDGFTFNKLHPYSSWEEIRDESKTLWDKYKEVSEPINIVRLALRYINRIEIPYPISNLNEYIISVPPMLKRSTLKLNENFFLRFQLEDEKQELSGIVNQTIELHPPEEPFLPLIFDIEVFSTQTFKPASEEIWQTFEKLHVYKNEIFFNNITEATQELFK